MDAAFSQRSDALERELKFALEPDDAVKLKEHPLLTWIRPTIKSMLSTYFDTADHALSKARLALRLRAIDGRVIQTFKLPSARSSGFFARGEYETDVAGTEPDLDHLRIHCPSELYEKLTFPLMPVFRVQMQRTEWLVRWKESSISLVLDRGSIRTDARSDAVEEIEIELQQGRIEDVFDFARQLAVNVALRLETLSKAERGYRLAGEETQKAEKAAEIKLDRKVTAAAGFQTIASLCIQHFSANERVFLATQAPEALHQMRVAIRRLRSLISFFDDMLPETDIGPLRHEIGSLFKCLGTARDLDVLLAALETQQELPAAVLEQIRLEREAAYVRLIALLKSQPLCIVLLDLLRFIECGAWMKASQKKRSAEKLNVRAATILKRQRKKLRSFNAASHLEAEKRHKLRIQAKKFRYACEFFGDLFISPKARHRQRDMSKMAEDLQDALGQLNDRVFMHQKLARWTGAKHALGAAYQSEEEASEKDLIKSAEAAQSQLLKEKRFWT